MTELSPVTILMIEDEAEIRKFLRVMLSSHGFKYLEAETGQEGIRLATLHQPDVILLDLGLPDGDGLQIIERLREWTITPILVLSARGQEESKIIALEQGADDYLTKPFSAGELLARIRVALRHANRRKDSPSLIYEAHGLKVDLGNRTVHLDGEDIKLTPTEYKLLSLLVKNVGKVMTYNQLLKEIWGKHSLENNNYLRIHMQHIRQKLKDNPLEPRFIITEAGVGYRFKG